VSAFEVPEGLMQRLRFVDEPVPEHDIPPRIDPELPVVFSPGDRPKA
jgi:hypothetical protein